MKDLFLDLSVKGMPLPTLASGAGMLSVCACLVVCCVDLPTGCSASSVVMQTELLPYLAVINVPLRNSGERSFTL